MSVYRIRIDGVCSSLILPCCFSIQIGEELLFLKAVSLCHTVQISYDLPDSVVGGGDPFANANGFSSNHMEFYASSPDEKALVEATKR